MLKSQTNVVLVRENEAAKNAVTTFDYSDLNSYLLVVVGLSRPEEDQVALFNEIMSKAQQGTDIPLREIQPICRQDTLITVPSDGNLSQAIEVLGSGIHRVLVTSPTGEVTGLVSQLRVVDFFWNEGVHFPSIDQLYPTILRDLGVGTQQIVSVKYVLPKHTWNLAVLTKLQLGLSTLGCLNPDEQRGSDKRCGRRQRAERRGQHLYPGRPSPHEHLGGPAPQLLVHALHLCHPQRARRGKGTRCRPSLLRQPVLNTCPHRGQAGRHKIPPHVGC